MARRRTTAGLLLSPITRMVHRRAARRADWFKGTGGGHPVPNATPAAPAREARVLVQQAGTKPAHLEIGALSSLSGANPLKASSSAGDVTPRAQSMTTHTRLTTAFFTIKEVVR